MVFLHGTSIGRWQGDQGLFSEAATVTSNSLATLLFPAQDLLQDDSYNVQEDKHSLWGNESFCRPLG